MYGLDTGGESVRGISWGVCAVKIQLKVVCISMEGDVRVVSEYVKHGEEVNIEEKWAEDRALGDTVGYGAGGGRVCIHCLHRNNYS